MLGTAGHAIVIKKDQNSCPLGAYILVMEEEKQERKLFHILEIDMCYGQKRLGGQMVTFETLENHKFPIKKEPTGCQGELVDDYTHLDLPV